VNSDVAVQGGGDSESHLPLAAIFLIPRISLHWICLDTTSVGRALQTQPGSELELYSLSLHARISS